MGLDCAARIGRHHGGKERGTGQAFEGSAAGLYVFMKLT
jgi:hypothetical protein